MYTWLKNKDKMLNLLIHILFNSNKVINKAKSDYLNLLSLPINLLFQKFSSFVNFIDNFGKKLFDTMHAVARKWTQMQADARKWTQLHAGYKQAKTTKVIIVSGGLLNRYLYPYFASVFEVELYRFVFINNAFINWCKPNGIRPWC